MGGHVRASAGPRAHGAAHEHGDHGQACVIQLDLTKTSRAGGGICVSTQSATVRDAGWAQDASSDQGKNNLEYLYPQQKLSQQKAGGRDFTVCTRSQQ